MTSTPTPKVAAELLIQFRPTVERQHWRSIVKAAGCLFLEEILPQRIALVRCPKGTDVAGMIKRLSGLPEVAYVEQNSGFTPEDQ